MAELKQKSCKRPEKKLKVGDVVIVESDKPRMLWKLGRIQNLYKGKDGIERIADVKTEGSVIKRAIQSLYPLECSNLNLK